MTREALLIGSADVSTFLVSVLRLTVNSEDSLSRANYNRFLGRAFDTPLNEHEQTFFRSLRLLSPEDAFERIVMHYELQHSEHHTAYLQAIHEQLITFCANRIADIPLFLRWWDEQGSMQSLSIEQSRIGGGDHDDSQGERARAESGHHSLLFMVAGPQNFGMGTEYRLGRSRRRHGRGRAISSTIRENNVRIRFFGGILP